MNWLEKLKAGDEVAVLDHGVQLIESVERITETQIVLKSELKYNKKSGRLIGRPTWSCDYISEATKDMVAAIRLKK